MSIEERIKQIRDANIKLITLSAVIQNINPELAIELLEAIDQISEAMNGS